MKKETKYTLAQAILIFFSLALVFLAGSFHEDNNFERVSEYTAQVVRNNTKQGKYCALAFDSSNKPNSYYGDELANLFDVFRSGVVTYTSGMNVNKEHNIFLTEANSDPISFVFVGAVGSSATKDQDTGSVTYRHYKYNFDTMFEDPVYNGTEYDKSHAPVVYLSQAQADALLLSRNEQRDKNGLYSREQYLSLIQQPVILNIDQDDCEYFVWNIYYERGFYYEGVSEVLGEFVLTSYYQPKDHNLNTEHKSIYFFNEYSYYNQYLMRYLNERLKDDKPEPLFVRNNISTPINEEFFLSFYQNSSFFSYHGLYIALLTLSPLLLTASLFLFYKNSKRYKFPFALSLLSLIFPYCLFKLIYVISNDVLFFSQASCKFNALFVILYIFGLLAILLFKQNKKIPTAEKTYYELLV